MKNLGSNLCLLLVSCVVGLSLCEVSLRVFYPKYRHLAEAQFRRDAFRIWARSPNSKQQEKHPDTSAPHFLFHNNLALRQHRDFSEVDLASATNIGVFGDSYVENIKIPVQYSFTEPLDYLLNQRRRRFNVLNFGVQGYGPGQSLLYYEHFRHAADLDHVVYVHCQNDIWDIYTTGLFRLDAAGHLVRNEAIRSSWWVSLMSRLHLPYLVLDVSGRLPSFLAHTAADDKRPRLRAGYRKRRREKRRVAMRDASNRGRAADYAHDDEQNSLSIFRSLIRHWKDLAEHNGSTFSVVLLPRYSPHPSVVTLLTAEDVEVIDLYTCFKDADPVHSQRPWLQSPYRYKNDPHWNEAGNRLAAVCLYRVLEEKMGLPKWSEEDLREALGDYYAAVGGEIPLKIAGERRARKTVSPETAAAIREKYLALEMRQFLKDEFVEVLMQRDKRIIASDFDVYLDGNRLFYVKEDCRPVDTRAPFFLHVIPVDESDLPAHRYQYGFDNLDFRHPRFQPDDKICGVIRSLPTYAVRSIRTGQYAPGTGRLWEANWSKK